MVHNYQLWQDRWARTSCGGTLPPAAQRGDSPLTTHPWVIFFFWLGGDLGAAPNTLVIEPPVPRGEELSKGCCCLLDVFPVPTAGPERFDPCVVFPSVILFVLPILFSECSFLIGPGCSECTLVCLWLFSLMLVMALVIRGPPLVRLVSSEPESGP